MPSLDMERASSLCLSPPPGKMAGIFGDGACGLALRALAVPLLRAEAVVAVDGANRFDPYEISKAARARGGDAREALSRVRVSRAFTCHQMEALPSRRLPEALSRFDARLAFLPSKRNRSVAVPNRFAGVFTNGEIKARGIALRRSDTPPLVAALQRELLERMAKAAGLSELRAMLPELREVVDAAVSELRGGRIPIEGLSIARRLSKAPERYVANTAAAAATRELCGLGVTLRPGSKIRYLLADRGGRAMGFLDGTETPDVPRYEAMLREAADELMEIVAGSR